MATITPHYFSSSINELLMLLDESDEFIVNKTLQILAYASEQLQSNQSLATYVLFIEFKRFLCYIEV